MGGGAEAHEIERRTVEAPTPARKQSVGGPDLFCHGVVTEDKPSNGGLLRPGALHFPTRPEARKVHVRRPQAAQTARHAGKLHAFAGGRQYDRRARASRGVIQRTDAHWRRRSLPGDETRCASARTLRHPARRASARHSPCFSRTSRPATGRFPLRANLPTAHHPIRDNDPTSMNPREQTVANAAGSLRIEGLQASQQARELADAWARGAATDEDLRAAEARLLVDATQAPSPPARA